MTTTSSTSTRSLSCLLLLCLGLTGCPSDPATDAGPDAPSSDVPTADAPAADAPADAPADAGPPPICATDADCDDGDACNGGETCAEDGLACEAGAALADGMACDADGMAGTRDLCVGGACAATRCGDGFTDATSLEECDDGNDVSGDGCDDCRFTCEDAADCDDGEACNGAETCSAAHVCEGGTMLANGTTCASDTGRCVAGTCLPNTCTMDDECQDGDMCNGAETCEATGCAPASAPTDCDDGDDCTMDGCDSATGCTHVFIDADRDGHAPSTLGACGTDCDDTRADVSPDAGEICGNLRDDDCDGMTDEVGVTTWHADCDGDGFAATGARTLDSCSAPAAGLAMCASGGGWTSRAPSDAENADCNDGNAAVSPAQAAFQTTAIPGAPAASDFDYDCDTNEEPRITTVGACRRSGLSCVLTEGWSASTPACGASSAWIVGCSAFGLTCTSMTEMRTQACR